MIARKNFWQTVGALCLLLAPACEEQMPEDAYGSSRDPAPAGAEMIGEAEYRAYVDAGNWFVVTQRTAQESEQAEAAQDAADEETIQAYAAAHPELGAIVPDDPPDDDPTITKRPDRNFDHVVSLPGDQRLTVVTYGRRWWLRTIANRIRVFPTRENQLQLYRGLYDGIPADFRRRLELASPDEIEADDGVTADDLLTLNRMIADPAIATPIIEALKAVDEVILPPMFLADCDEEIGFGTEGDLTSSVFDGTCDFDVTGIVRNYNWPLRQYLTCVKSQACRGTCTGFANTAAIEILVGKIHGPRVNLSEQAYYNRARTKWDTPYGSFDGLMSEIGFKGMADEAWLLYFENQWNYNPSCQRVTTCVQTDSKGSCVQQAYTNSCVNYTETCSDTVHQSQFGCAAIGPWWFCGFWVPEKNPGNFGYRIGSSSQFWDPTNPQFSLTLMRLCLAAGYPVVLGHPITTAWDCAEISTPGCAGGGVDGFMPYVASDTNRGGHGSCAVGFIDNDDLATFVPGAPPGAGGGYIIVKNSWGNCWGDGGFLYIPYQAVMDYAADTTVLFSVL